MADKTTEAPGEKSAKKTKAEQREERLREALRVNMHRRKSQKRARQATDKDEQDG